MNECLNNEPNYITYYNSIQMCLPLGLGYEITPTDELLSFLEAIKGVDLSKYMVRKETRGRKGHNRIDLLRLRSVMMQRRSAVETRFLNSFMSMLTLLSALNSEKS